MTKNERTEQKIFVLCLGCQKSGTSWLRQYLSHSKNFNGGFTKEYHVWDYVDIEEQRKKIDSSLSAMRFIGHLPKNIKLRRMRSSENYYFRYFNSLFSDEVSVTADITPSYSGLSKVRMKKIKDEMERLNITVKPIILFRDPVERIKSAVRMNFNRRRRSDFVGFDPSIENFGDALNQYYRSEHCKLRTSYKETLTNAKSVFGDNVQVMIFEEMFTEDGVKQISDFCSTDYLPKLTSMVPNPGKKTDVDTTSIEKDIRGYYAMQYEYFYSQFPQTQQLWN